MRIRQAARRLRPRSLAARTTLASTMAAAVLFTAGAWSMRHATYDQQMAVATADAQQEANVILDVAAGTDIPTTADNFGRFPYELVTSSGLISSSTQLKAFETGGQGSATPHAFMPLPPYPVHDVDWPTTVVFPDSAPVRGNPLAGTTTPVLEFAELLAGLRSLYNDPDALPGVPNNALALVYVFVTSGNAQAAVSTLDHTLYPGVPTAVLLVAAVAYLAIRRALRPVEAIRARTAAVTAADPRERVDVPDTGDEIARLAATINNTLQRLDDAAQAQRRFVADAAHELRSQISSLLIGMEVAEAYQELADWRETIAATAEQARRIHALAEDLLLLARMDATAPAGGPAQTVDLSALARDIADAPGARPAADPGDSTGHTVSMTCHADADVLVHGDRGGLERVLRNLTDNARRHARSRVAVRVYAAEEHAVIEVEDDGSGVPATDRERIFERFTRLDDARSREFGGFGLGLAIVRDIVERHHGTIEVTDAAAGPGSGARFTVRIPGWR